MYPILDTRVECKFISFDANDSDIVVRIKPEWNVNITSKYGYGFINL